MDSTASRIMSEDIKGHDRLRRMKAVAAHTFDTKVSAYQETCKSTLAILYDAADKISRAEIPRTELVKTLGNALAILYKQNKDMIADRRDPFLRRRIG
jgi:hypothetical protein